jgi:hypothetical protein
MKLFIMRAIIGKSAKKEDQLAEDKGSAQNEKIDVSI